MRFDENDFRHLVAETIVTVNRLGTTSHSVLERYPRFTEMLVQHLSTLDQPFSFEQCIEWVNSLEHDSASTASADYVDWKALHRFVCLLAEQKAGTLSEYRHYLSCTPKMPVTEEYKKMLSEFQVFMKEEGRRINPCNDPEGFLFYPSASGSKEMMSEDNVQRILKKYGDAARCTNPNLPSIHPHLLRHSYGAQLYRLGVSLPEIAKLLGHENLATTEIYAETDPEMAAHAISNMLGKQPVRKWDSLTEDEKLKVLGLK